MQHLVHQNKKRTNQRKSRELALQMLFKLDCLGSKKALKEVSNKEISHDDENTSGVSTKKDDLNFLVYKNLLRELIQVDGSCWEEADHLVKGVLGKKDLLDQMVDQNMNDAVRLSYVDRNILRIGLYEMSIGKKPNIVINEAIEVAKTYSTTESSKLVNRVLDQAKTFAGDK